MTAIKTIETVMTSGAPPPTKIFVGRLPPDANPQDLRTLFEKYGIVTECDILNRYGFVHMKTEEMAQAAIRELNNAEFMGVRISVEQSTGKKSGMGGRGGRGGSFGMMRGRGGSYGMGMGRGGMGMGSLGMGSMRPSPYDRGPRDYERRGPLPPMDRGLGGGGGGGMGGDRLGLPPPPAMRNGYYDSYERGGGGGGGGGGSYDDYYNRRGPPAPPPPSMVSRDREMMYSSYNREPERRMYPDAGRDSFDRRNMGGSPLSAYDRRNDYGGRVSSDAFRRSSYDRDPSYDGMRDSYGPPVRRSLGYI